MFSRNDVQLTVRLHSVQYDRTFYKRLRLYNVSRDTMALLAPNCFYDISNICCGGTQWLSERNHLFLPPFYLRNVYSYIIQRLVQSTL